MARASTTDASLRRLMQPIPRTPLEERSFRKKRETAEKCQNNVTITETPTTEERRLLDNDNKAEYCFIDEYFIDS